MFGYVKIDKNELKVKDYNLFKSYYCGLCQRMKQEYGFPARYFLSYDVTFLTVLLSALCPKEPDLSPIRCMANPTVRRPAVVNNDALSYGAAVNVLLTWFKLWDDWADNRSLKALVLMPFMAGKRKKAQKKYPALYEKIKASLERLSALEKENCRVPDMPAGAFGQLMADVFTQGEGVTAEQKRILFHCGMLLGRFIYLLDAWADKEEDEKKKAYNPFLLADMTKAEDVKLSLEYTLGELGNSLGLLKLEKNKDIIENIIYLGLANALENVFDGQKNTACGSVKEKHHERPL